MQGTGGKGQGTGQGTTQGKATTPSQAGHETASLYQEAGQYDPADFLVAPADAKGVSYRLTFRVPPDMEKAIDQIISSHKFPFTTRGEVLRWTTLQGIKALEKMEAITSVSKRVDILTTLLNEEAGHSEFLAIFNHLEEGVAKYLADQAIEQATRVVALAKHQFEAMPDGYWRGRYLDELKVRFSHLLDKAGVNLVLIKPGPAGTGVL